MDRRKFLRGLLFSGMAVAAIRIKSPGHVLSQTETPPPPRKRITQADREAAAERMRAAKKALLERSPDAQNALVAALPGGTPDYFGVANWANSPALRKFVDTLPGVYISGKTPLNTVRNNLLQYIPAAIPDTTTYPDADYYEIEVGQYTEKMHSDLPPTTLRGYRQTNTNDPVVSAFHYLGPLIVATRDRPVRLKFTNSLPAGSGGDLFVPVDTTTMGAGMGPLMHQAMPMNYTQNRAVVHLHGGRTPWISDGTPHQWITPIGETSPYKKGVSATNVPDMPDPGPGSQTYYFTNQQSARMLFYHDHSFGITRLNVYAGEAAGYLIRDGVEEDLMNGTNATGVNPGLTALLPADEIPLIIQDKSFVDETTVRLTDPTWNWGTGAPAAGVRPPVRGDLWYPHVYVPAQNPGDLSGINPWGRWHYGPWFWPPTNDITHPPVPNPYYDPTNAPWEPPLAPGVPDVSMPGESFFDTPVVNGTAFPTLNVEPKAYRFRILNAANDRFFNLQWYLADGTVTSSDQRTNTEVKMTPAAPNAPYLVTYPDWPTDGRAGGVPDPAFVGPTWLQIGNEGGFLPAPAEIPNQPISWNMDPTTFNFGNVADHSLLVGTAERADVIVDFSAFPGQTLILYNDAPAAFPALDARYDYYTDAPDLRDTGGHSGPLPGFGPNTRTIMQVVVANTTPADPYDRPALEAAFAKTATKQGVFAASQDPIIIPYNAYNTAYNATLPIDQFARIYSTSMTFRTISGVQLSIPCEPKALQDEMGEAYDQDYGRMSGKLGVQLPNAGATQQQFVLQNYVDPASEYVYASPSTGEPVAIDGTQIWKITHNGVDTHTLHFHLFDVQLINRVGWDGFIRLPDANELGWKDTVRTSPLEDTIVALRPVTPVLPFGVPDSIRPLDPTMPIGSPLSFTNINTYTGQAYTPPVTNQLTNFGWEYVWHCHLLSHEEMDMMRPVVFRQQMLLPTASVLSAALNLGNLNLPGVDLTWTDPTPPDSFATLGNPSNEIGYRIERALGSAGAFAVIATVPANLTTFTDMNVVIGGMYRYQVVAYNSAGDTVSNIASILIPTPYHTYMPAIHN